MIENEEKAITKKMKRRTLKRKVRCTFYNTLVYYRQVEETKAQICQRAIRTQFEMEIVT